MVAKIALASALAVGMLVASGIQTCEALPGSAVVIGRSSQPATLAYWRGGWRGWRGGWGGWHGGCWNCGWHRGRRPWVGWPYYYGYGSPYFYRPYYYGYYPPYYSPNYSAGAPYYPPQPNLK